MKIKYNKSPIYNIILFITITTAGIFNIVSLPIISEMQMQYNITFVLVVALFFNALINKKVKTSVKAYTAYFYAFMVYLALFIIVHCFYGAIKYDQGIRSLFATAKYFIIMVLFVPLIYVIHINNGYEQLLRNIAAVTLVIMAAKTLKAFAFNFAGINIFNAIDTGTRYGRLRTGLPVFGPISYIYYINKLLNTKSNKQKYYIYLAIVVYFIFFVIYINMTRMNIIGYLLTLVIMLLVKKRPKNKQIIAIFIIGSFAAVLLSSNIFDNFVSSFSETEGELSASTLAREYADDYFKTFPAQNPSLGMGFLCPDTPIRAEIFYGKTFNCLDDLGIKNMYYHYGISGIIFAVLVLGRMLYLAVYIIFFSNSKNKLIISGMTVFVAFTQPSLCIFDGQRILSLIFYWAIFEYEYAKSKKVKEKYTIKNLLSRRGNRIEQPKTNRN